ncbi:MAG: LysR family transcriptional regulator [Myxococcota bacterium]
MDRFQAMTVFARVARLGAFSAAARELQLSTTAVSRQVAQLEEHLGVRLLQRTTRRLSITDAGAAYLSRCERILADVHELEDALSEGQDNPRGRLRISAGVSFAQEQLGTLMPAFVERYPDLEVDLLLTDRHLDLITEGIDVAVRIGRLSDSSLIARRLAPIRHALCASPAYLAEHGGISAPAELAGHHCIIDTNQSRTWWFEGEGGVENVVAEGRYRVNNGHGACDAARAGLGVAYLPTFIAGSHLASGELIRLMPGYRVAEMTMFAVYPENRYLSASVRAFIDVLAEHFGGEPPWDRVCAGSLSSVGG